MTGLKTSGVQASAVQAGLEKHIVPVLLALSAYYFAFTCCAALWKLPWYDELLTLRIAELPSVSAILAALPNFHADPPSYSVLTHFFVAVFGATPFAIRVPSIIGFWVGMLSIYLFLSYCIGRICAAAGAIFVQVTFAAPYAYEGRPYAALFGASAFTLLLWRRAAEKKTASAYALFALSAFSIICMHYYGVLVIGALAAGELVRTVRDGRVCWPMWLGIAAGFTPLVFFYRFYHPAHSYETGGMRFVNWNSPHPGDPLRSYMSALEPAAVPLFVFLVLIVALTISRADRQVQELPLWTRVEWTAVAGIGLLPIEAYALGRVTGAYQTRYVLPTIIAFAIVFAMAVFLAGGRRGALSAACFWMVTVWACGRTALFAKSEYASRNERTGVLNVLIHTGNLPIAMAPSRAFYELWSGAGQNLRNRLWCVLDNESDLRYTGSNIFDFQLPMLQRYDPIQLSRLDSFIASNPSFYVYTRGGSEKWLVPKLVESGCRLEVASDGSYGRVFSARCGRGD